MTKTVPPTTDTDELTGYAATAAELHRIADDLAKLSDQPGQSSFTIYLQPHRSKADDDVTKAAVDAVGMALYGKPGEYLRMTSGKYHYVRYGYRGAIQLQIFQEVSGPPDERDVELERLRAELAEVRQHALPKSQVSTPTHMRRVEFALDQADVDAMKFSDDPAVRAAAQAYEDGDDYGHDRVDNGDASAEVPNGVEGGPVTGRATGGA